MKKIPLLALLTCQLTHRKTTTCICSVCWLFPCCWAVTSRAVLDLARLTISRVDQMIKVTPLQVFKNCGRGIPAHCPCQPSPPLGSASSERLANPKGVSCSRAEPWFEKVGEGGREAIKTLQAEREKHLFFWKPVQLKVGVFFYYYYFLNKLMLFIVGCWPKLMYSIWKWP